MSPFAKNDPKTIAAAKRGGKTGTKHFETVPKEKLRKITANAGRLSGKSRRESRAKRTKRIAQEAAKIEDRVMRDYYI